MQQIFLLEVPDGLGSSAQKVHTSAFRSMSIRKRRLGAPALAVSGLILLAGERQKLRSRSVRCE